MLAKFKRSQGKAKDKGGPACDLPMGPMMYVPRKLGSMLNLKSRPTPDQEKSKAIIQNKKNSFQHNEKSLQACYRRRMGRLSNTVLGYTSLKKIE